ncbi:MAG: hypothetical protein ACTS5Y_03410, partial [Pollutimonas bauzanensis]
MTNATTTLPAGSSPGDAGPGPAQIQSAFARTLRGGPVLISLFILALVIFVAILAPWLHTVDPTAINPGVRLKPIT